ncbi:hypothetical protein MXB02_20365 [Pseudomonas mosselii]|uniref:hypothetical protein n=1 Tax=Pseudomonas mosselii TaxID=78327 RepID=UPI001FFA9DDA|nr:hypothetical protein [Pseudomonas mosselii]UPF02905.1 hypothetical protein MXB02_20365 [Pseudomonas mosselii]
MAKVEYVVVDGCIQDAGKVVKAGEVFVPSSAAIRELLLEEGAIVARGKLSTGGRSSGRSPSAGPPAPAPAPAPGPDAGGGNPDEEEEEEEEDEDEEG